MAKLYQLCIEKLIYEDWSGTIFRSRLYPSKRQCLHGCLNEELPEIVRAVCQQADDESFQVEDPDVIWSEMDPETKAVFKKIKAWLKNDANPELYPVGRDGQSIFWERVSFEVVSTQKGKKS